MSYTLYKWRPAWGLPSLSPACIQAEAYLRFAGVNFRVEECSSASTSPSGQLPAVELDAELSEGKGPDFVAADAVITFLRSHIDLDQHLSIAQHSDRLAFKTAIEAKLNLATTYTTWGEKTSFRNYTRVEYGATLPGPLAYYLMLQQCRSILAKLPSQDPTEIYMGAAEVYEALAQRLQTTRSQGGYFFGSKPTSIDALLFGHLLFHAASPVAAPELKHLVDTHPVLKEYIERISTTYFSAPVPMAPAAASPEWQERAERAQSAGGGAGGKKALSEEEKKLRQRSWLWLGCAAAALVAYVLFSGQYADLYSALEYDDDVDEDEDD